MPKPFLIGYDIQNNRVRRNACKILRQYSDGYQKSVFELNLSRQELFELLPPLINNLDVSTDKLFLIAQPRQATTWQLGHGIIMPNQSTWVIN